MLRILEIGIWLYFENVSKYIFATYKYIYIYYCIYLCDILYVILLYRQVFFNSNLDWHFVHWVHSLISIGSWIQENYYNMDIAYDYMCDYYMDLFSLVSVCPTKYWILTWVHILEKDFRLIFRKNNILNWVFMKSAYHVLVKRPIDMIFT